MHCCLSRRGQCSTMCIWVRPGLIDEYSASPCQTLMKKLFCFLLSHPLCLVQHFFSNIPNVANDVHVALAAPLFAVNHRSRVAYENPVYENVSRSALDLGVNNDRGAAIWSVAEDQS